MRILLVEDDPKMARLLRRGLEEEAHVVDVCADGLLALEQAQAVPYDVIALDWSLPGMDGLSVLRELRAGGLRTPVLMLTARGTSGEKVMGLRSGADDYLTKPFDFEELLARLEALHRRVGDHAAETQLGDLVLDAQRRALSLGDRVETLTGREFALLSEFAGHRGEVLTRSRILSKVWGTDFDATPNLVDVYVGYLRAKLARLGPHRVTIQAVRGAGYRLEVDTGNGT